MIPNTFEQITLEKNIARINILSAETTAKWGTMNAPQMLAHLNVAYHMALDENTVITRGFKRFLISLLAKKMVVSDDKTYPKNGRTSPAFVIADQRDFEQEKTKLLAFLKEVNTKGASYFEGKESQSFGALSAKEWSNLFQKHLNHHLEQFGV